MYVWRATTVSSKASRQRKRVLSSRDIRENACTGSRVCMMNSASSRNLLAGQGVDGIAALFKNLDPSVPVHDSTVGLDPQALGLSRPQRIENGGCRLSSPVFKGE